MFLTLETCDFLATCRILMNLYFFFTIRKKNRGKTFNFNFANAFVFLENARKNNDIRTYVNPFFSLQLPLYLSLRSDINCLLPNLIRNFRRRDNLTSFLFSLTRSEASCTGVSFPGFFYPRVSERASVTRARPCSSLYLFNLYRYVVRT